MRNQKEQLKTGIKKLERKFRIHQARANFHQEKLVTLFQGNWIMFGSALLPAFVWGWGVPRKRGTGSSLIQTLINVGAMSAGPYLNRLRLH